MLKLNEKTLKMVLWIAVGLLSVLLVIPGVPPSSLSQTVPVNDTQNTLDNVLLEKSQGDIQTVADPVLLSNRLFGAGAPIVAVHPQTSTIPVKTPAPIPLNATIRYLGMVSVEGSRKLVFSDTVNQVSFAISPGERYAGWTCISIGEFEAIMSREGIKYRVPIQK